MTRNYSEKVINKVLDLISASQQMELLQSFYETTLTALQVPAPVVEPDIPMCVRCHSSARLRAIPVRVRCLPSRCSCVLSRCACLLFRCARHMCARLMGAGSQE